MKLLKVYRTDEDLVIETTDGYRVCKLRHSNNNFIDIDALESKCKLLVGKDVITIAFQHERYGGTYFYKISEASVKEDSLEELKESLIKKIPLGKIFSNHSSQKLFGPPGTGKTFTLLKEVEGHIKNGVKPEDIAFISFTNAAANEAKKRVAGNFEGLGSINFPNFSTMHSLATKMGGNNAKELCLEEHWKEFDKAIFCFTEWTETNDPFSAVSRFKHPVLDLYSLAQARETSLAEELKKKFESDDYYDYLDLMSIQSSLQSYFNLRTNQDLDSNEKLEYAQRYVDRYSDFKRSKNLVDFNDVIINTAGDNFDEEKIPTFEVLIIDEAQDLSDNLWSLAKKLIKKAGTVLIAGDDDQAIMINFGASAYEFLNIKTTKDDLPLPKSYRVPPEVMKYLNAGVMNLIKALPNRKEKIWDTANHSGSVSCMSDKNYIDKNGTEHNDYFLEYEINDLLKEVIIKKEEDWLILCPTKKTGVAISNALLEQDPPVPHFYRNRPKPNLIEIEIERNDSEEKEVLQISTIRVQSIHTSKGDQAKNVAIVVGGIGDIAMLVNDTRLSYVALTRAKINLFPRVVKAGLLPSMLDNPDYRGLAQEYMKIFPAERKIKGIKSFFS